MTATLPPMTQRWLRCKVEKGMFSDERVVLYPATGDATKSAFVPANEVQGEPGKSGTVRVWVGRNQDGVMAFLPTEYRDCVFVQEQDLTD